MNRRLKYHAQTAITWWLAGLCMWALVAIQFDWIPLMLGTIHTSLASWAYIDMRKEIQRNKPTRT